MRIGLYGLPTAGKTYILRCGRGRLVVNKELYNYIFYFDFTADTFFMASAVILFNSILNYKGYSVSVTGNRFLSSI